MPDNNISKAQPSKAKGLGGVLTIRSKNAALLYMYRLRTSISRIEKTTKCKVFSQSEIFISLETHIISKIISYKGRMGTFLTACCRRHRI